MTPRQIRQAVNSGFAAGVQAARNGIPVTQCPFGVCRGMQDEYHDNVWVSSWVLGYGEEVARRDILVHWRLGADLSDLHGFAIASPKNPRVKQALIDGFTALVVRVDIVSNEVLH